MVKKKKKKQGDFMRVWRYKKGMSSSAEVKVVGVVYQGKNGKISIKLLVIFKNVLLYIVHNNFLRKIKWKNILSFSLFNTGRNRF